MEELNLFITDDNCRSRLQAGLSSIKAAHREVIWLCIGTDKQLADSLGPLIGTMLYHAAPGIGVVGRLDAPVHAKNLRSQVRRLWQNHPDAVIIAIDAAAGPHGQIGRIRLREGGLLPGKALAKSLPVVGDYSLTAVVQVHSHFRNEVKPPGLGLIYNLAATISAAIAECYT